MSSWFDRLAKKEENLFSDLVDRASVKTPNWSNDGVKLGGWEGLIVEHWPTLLTVGYWHYLFGELRKGHWGGYDADRWINLPSPITDTEEWRYFLKDFRWWQLTEETKLERVVCRFRGHPKGEIYYSSGDEPDHHCKTCGEEIG